MSEALRLLAVVEVEGAGLEPSVLRAEERVVGMVVMIDDTSSSEIKIDTLRRALEKNERISARE